jgi:hypothetical protein
MIESEPSTASPAHRVRQLVRRGRSTPLGESIERGYNELVFRRDQRARRRAHPTLSPASTDATVQTLRRDGFAIIRDAVSPALVERLAAELDACFAERRHLNRPSLDAGREAGDLAEAAASVSDADLAQGEARLRELTNYVSVDQPFVACPTAVELAFLPLLIDLASAYLRCPPAIGGVNLRRSYVNDLPEFDTLHFHSDPNSPRFLKFFFYLNDVDDRGGPFAYVPGTHRDKFRGWRRKYRWTPQEIASIYGEDRIVYATANVGDLVVADTTGFHRGTKTESRDRSMLTVNYVVHKEFRGRQEPFEILASSMLGFTPSQLAAADFLRVVTGD